MSNRVAIIGIGNVGATIAYTFILRGLAAHIMLVDANTKRCEGEEHDLADALAFSRTTTVKQTCCAEARNADFIIIAAGFAQKPGETRLDLVTKNAAVIRSIMQNLEPINPNSIVLMITNPVDIMTSVAQSCCSLPKNRVIGSGTWLDTQRLRRYLGAELCVAPESITAFIIGEHGDSQCVAWSQATVGGTPLEKTNLSAEQRVCIAEKTRQEVYLIIEKKCATFYGIAACVADIYESVLFDQKRILPVSSYHPSLGVCLSLPVVLGCAGVEQELLLQLSTEERTCLHEARDTLNTYISHLST
jgi:L-lactate dehydrogenase